MSGGERQSTISPTSFAVAPEVIGLPLAGGGRRLVAMLIDLAAVGLLLKAGSWFFAIGAAIALWRASSRWVTGSRTTINAMRLAAAVVLFFSVLSFWRMVRKSPDKLVQRIEAAASDDSDDTGSAAAAAATKAKQSISIGDLIGGAVEYKALNSAKDERKARVLADHIVARMKKGMSNKDLREMRASLAQDSTTLNPAKDGDMKLTLTPMASRSLRAALATIDTANAATGQPESEENLRRDSVTVAYAAAVRQSKEGPPDSLREALVTAVAGDTIDRLKERVRELHDKNRELTESHTKMQQQPLLEIIKGVANDLGLGFGWLGLYFTAFLALWKGQTPGKRVMGIRVVRLDGKPMTWWASFERFGGYSASVITGLLGFAQLLWDRNRQALHDKISETVVVRNL